MLGHPVSCPACSELGYEVAHVGFNQWNGVAIASRVGLDDVQVGFDGQPSWSSKPDVAASSALKPAPSVPPAAVCGYGACTCPTGAHLPIRTTNTNWTGLPRFAIPAEGWLRDDPAAPIAMVGDWNIAPTDDDIWSIEFYVGSTHVSEPERSAFDAIVDAQFADVVRPFTPGPGVYTYWDYTQLRFPKRQGMRIDFILGSPALPGGWSTRRSSGRSAKERRPRSRPGGGGSA